MNENYGSNPKSDIENNQPTEMMFREDVSIMFKVKDQQMHQNIIKWHYQDTIKLKITESVRTMMKEAKQSKFKKL